MTRSYSDSDLKLLWGLAAARCASPGCRVELVATPSADDRAAVIGEIAHIVAHEDRGPRGDATYPRDRRDTYDNLLLLCPNHHTVIDKQPRTYTIAQLRAWKSEHEAWVRDRLSAEIGHVSFVELEVVTAALARGGVSHGADDLRITRPLEKIAKNGLSRAVEGDLTLGLARAAEVARFVQHMASVDPSFPDRLKGGFAAEYTRLRDDGAVGDSLFVGLCAFAGRGRRDFRIQAAGLAVLAYLFEACEVFEK